MGEIRTIKDGTNSNVEFDETRTSNTPNYRKQPKAANEDGVTSTLLGKAFKILTIAFITLVIGGSIGVIIFMFQSQISLFSINGISMEPTLKNGNSVILKQSKNIENGQIVFFRKPKGWTKIDDQETLVKRIVAIPGDTLRFDGKSFYVNNNAFYTLENGYDCSAAPQNYEITLNRAQIFIAGDNAMNSIDSRKMFCTGKLDKMFVPKQSFIVSGEVIAQF